MLRNVGLRVGELLVVLLIVSMGVFLLVAMLPGDPAVAILGQGQPPEAYAALRTELGLDRPLYERYLDWLGGAVTGDLGSSVVPPQSGVADRIVAALPVSVELAALGLFMALVAAVPLAMWSAQRPGGAADRSIGAVMFALLSMPSFLVGLLLIMIFANGLGWFPRAEWVRISESVPDNLYHAFLPALTIALMELALFTRVLRSDLVATLREDYILAARAKGMSSVRIMFVDALRPSSFSLVTLLGLSLGRLIGSTVIVEYLFALPGMGNLIVTSASEGDFPMVVGAVLVVALAYVLINLLIDLSYGLLDPRTRRASA